MLITSGFNFEGYRITHYLGFFSGETALGTGVFSEFFASWADFFGTESNSFADKLEEAKHYAMDSLISKVRAAGGNAIIGLDVDYNMFMSNMIGVIANGTAVCVESIGVEKEEAVTAHLPAMPLDIDAPLRATGLRIAGDSVALEMVLYKGVAPRAVSAEVTLRTAFGEDACMGDIAFLDVAPIPGKDGHWLQSGYARLAKPLPTAAISATVRILAQMDTDGVDTLRELRRRYGEDAICTFEEDENGWRCVCGMHNPAQSTRCALCSRQKDGKATALTVEMLAEAEKRQSAAEIWQYLAQQGLGQAENTVLLMGQLQQLAQAEQQGGSQLGQALRILQGLRTAVELPNKVICPSCGFTCTRDFAKARKKCPDCGAQLLP